LITEQLKERWVVQAVDQGAIGGAMSGAFDGPVSNHKTIAIIINFKLL
jgi:hypothetical protein